MVDSEAAATDFEFHVHIALTTFDASCEHVFTNHRHYPLALLGMAASFDLVLSYLKLKVCQSTNDSH